MPHGVIGRIVGTVLEADARGEPLDPAALALLLRHYVATGRDEAAAAVERGLARGLDTIAGADDDAAWLELFAEAAPLTDDERLPAAAEVLTARVRATWPSRRGGVAAAMRSAGACLAASRILDSSTRNAVIRSAVDELERIVGRVYRPGEAIAHSLEKPDEDDGDLRDHVESAAALLNAYEISGRLPYSMLAEELVQRAARTLTSDDFFVRGAMARVLCRLAALHDDEEYRQIAVLAGQSDYAADAGRMLTAMSPQWQEFGAAAAIYGLAMDEWLRVTRQMQ